MNTSLKNSEAEKTEKGKARTDALLSDLDTMIKFVNREDVDFKEAIDFIRAANEKKLWIKVENIVKEKASCYILDKNPEEKIIAANDIKLNFFYDLVFKDPGVQKILSKSFSVKSSVLENEKAAILSS